MPYLLKRAAALAKSGKKLGTFFELGRIVGSRARMRETSIQSAQMGKRENVDTTVDGRVMFDLLPFVAASLNLTPSSCIVSVFRWRGWSLFRFRVSGRVRGRVDSVFGTASPWRGRRFRIALTRRRRRDATHTTSQRIARTKSATRAGTCSATTSSRPTP
mgnify:FL=1